MILELNTSDKTRLLHVLGDVVLKLVVGSTEVVSSAVVVAPIVVVEGFAVVVAMLVVVSAFVVVITVFVVHSFKLELPFSVCGFSI